MSAGHLVNRDAKTLARDPPLEIGRKKPIVAPHENMGWYRRPGLETAA